MLHFLKLQHVGPAPELEIEFAPRMNFLTGDNGLGKSFLLEIAWWALTRTWASAPAAPQRLRGIDPSIYFQFDSKTGPLEHTSTFDRRTQAWTSKRGRPANPGLVIYAQSDGGFSVWDPARNYRPSSVVSMSCPTTVASSSLACRTSSPTSRPSITANAA